MNEKKDHNAEIMELTNTLFKFQPYEIVPIMFDYLAAALESAPPNITLDEMIKRIKIGIEEAIIERKKQYPPLIKVLLP